MVIIEYSDNYLDPAASLHQFKRQKRSYDNDNLKDIINLTAANSSSFKYKSGLIEAIGTQIDADVNPNIPLAHRLFHCSIFNSVFNCCSIKAYFILFQIIRNAFD